jgi:hypothetical protein
LTAFPARRFSVRAKQEIDADCTLVLEKTGGDRVKTEEYRCKRLMRFAQEHPEAPEAAKAVLQAAHLRESLGQNDEAGQCYRYLIAHFPNDPAARKAGGALWRLGQNHQPLELQLPLLYASDASGKSAFDTNEMRGRLLVVYFWTNTSPHVEEDFNRLKQLTDRYADQGLAIVYVNMDNEAASARAFLSGRLTAGVHVHQPGGLDGPVAERYGIQETPHIFLVARDGMLLKHSLTIEGLETELADLLPRRR